VIPGGLRVVKGHGTQNDFVVVPDLDGRLDLTPALVRALCDRRAGVGGDGVLRVVPTAAVPAVAHLAGEAEWFMDYVNADGSVAEMCGNGIRVYARYLVEAGLVPPGPLRLATRGGVKSVEVETDGEVTVDMGAPAWPEDGARSVSVSASGRTWTGSAVSMGNPHVVVAVDDLAEAGPLLQAPELAPRPAAGANVEFVVRRSATSVAMRVHERGVGETRSCGTGACAVIAVLTRDEPTRPTYDVDVPGGRLQVRLGRGGGLLLRGPAVLVAEAELSKEWLAAVE